MILTFVFFISCDCFFCVYVCFEKESVKEHSVGWMLRLGDGEMGRVGEELRKGHTLYKYII